MTILSFRKLEAVGDNWSLIRHLADSCFRNPEKAKILLDYRLRGNDKFFNAGHN